MDVSLTKSTWAGAAFEPFNSLAFVSHVLFTRLRTTHALAPVYIAHGSIPPKRQSKLSTIIDTHTYRSIVSRQQSTSTVLQSRAMSKPASSSSFLLLLLLSATLLATVCRADPDPVQDFCVAVAPGGHNNASSSSSTYPGFPCKPPSTVVSDDFFFAAHAGGASTDNPMGAGVTPGNVEAFPGLNTLGLSINRVDLAPGGVNPLHTHPRSAELVHVEAGEMLVGFVSTEGRFYSKVVRAGESFVIPRGMVHFQYNVGKAPARAMTVFNSQLPGVVLAAQTLFGADPEIPDDVLAKSFQVDTDTIKLLKSKFQKG